MNKNKVNEMVKEMTRCPLHFSVGNKILKDGTSDIEILLREKNVHYEQMEKSKIIHFFKKRF